MNSYIPFQGYLRMEWRPRRRWEFDATYFTYAARSEEDPPLGRQRFDARVGYALSEALSLSAGAQNLTAGNRREIFKNPGIEPGPIRPAVYVRLRFTR
jgi:hypothetical protein